MTQKELHERAKLRAPSAQFVTVSNFLEAPEYDEIIQQLTGNAATSFTTQNLQSHLPQADLRQMTDIIIVYDHKKGSATMGLQVLKERLIQVNIDIPIRKETIATLNATKRTLIITTEDLKEDVKKKNKDATLLIVDSLVTTKQYDKIVHALKNAS